MGKNAIVGQSGGPTSVINASLAGVFESCKNRGAEIVYGMCNGVAGLLEERVVDLSTVLTDDLDIELLKRTPSSFLGSCRYKLPDWHEDETVYKKLFAILEKLNIGYFFYIGGNDSMDTIGKLAEYGERIQSDIRFMGVPKTIDNDLMVTDHTPGYGSAAKYIGVVMKEIIRDATVYGTKYVTVVEIMGRNAGWLTAAAALAKSDDCEGVDMICLPEVPFNVEHFIEKVRVMQEKKPRSPLFRALRRSLFDWYGVRNFMALARARAPSRWSEVDAPENTPTWNGIPFSCFSIAFFASASLTALGLPAAVNPLKPTLSPLWMWDAASSAEIIL